GREARGAEPVHARGRGRVEAAPELELAARARLEPPEPARDAVLDPRVVADVEVEMADRALGAPVAAVERVALGDVEGAGDHTAVLPRDDEHEARAHALARQREEALVQVLLPPGELRDRAAVEHEHAREEPCADESSCSPQVRSSAAASVAMTSPRSTPGAARKRAPVTGVKGTATSSFG